MSDKHYYVELNHQQGEFQSHHSFLVTASSQDEAEKQAEGIASRWWGDCENQPDENELNYEFNGGEIIIEVGSVTEISNTTYNEIKGKGISYDLTSR